MGSWSAFIGSSELCINSLSVVGTLVWALEKNWLAGPLVLGSYPIKDCYWTKWYKDVQLSNSQQIDGLHY